MLFNDSVENQKGVIAIDFVQRQRLSGSQRTIFNQLYRPSGSNCNSTVIMSLIYSVLVISSNFRNNKV